MQEDLIQPLLSVDEAMMVAANLKLSKEFKPSDKVKIVSLIHTFYIYNMVFQY